MSSTESGAAYPLGNVPLSAVMQPSRRTPPMSPSEACERGVALSSPALSWVSAESLDSIISLANKSEEQMELDGLIYRLCHSLYRVAKNKSAKIHRKPVDDECCASLGDDVRRFRNMRGHKDWCPLRHLFDPSSYYKAIGRSNPHVGCKCLGEPWAPLNDPASVSQWLANELSVTRLSGGNTNHVYRLCHESYPGKALLLRVYGDGGSGVIDRARDVKAMKQMSKAGMSPTVLHSFQWGRVEEFMDGVYTCTTEMLLASPPLLADIYEGLCRMHQLDAVPFLPGNVDDGRTLGTCQSRLPSVDEVAAKLEGCDDYYSSMARSKALESVSRTSFERACFRLLRLMSLHVKEAHRESLVNWLSGEIMFVSSAIQRRESPIVFSHNDLNPGNILLSRRKVPAAFRGANDDNKGKREVNGEDGASVTSSAVSMQRLTPNGESGNLVERCGYLFIDYEYADVNYRCFDLGNTLCELDYDYTRGTEAGGRGFIKFLFVFPPAAKAEAWRDLGEEYPRMPELILDAWRRCDTGSEASDIGSAALLAIRRYFATRDGVPVSDVCLSEAQLCEVLLGMLASHLHWTLWAMVMGCVPDECAECAVDGSAGAEVFAFGGSGLDYMRYGQGYMGVTQNPYTGRVLSSRYYTLLSGREKLPVFAAKEKIQKLVARYQTLLLVGETGSGKTTQVPQFLLEMNPERAIACTQPRRVAATSVSERVAEELDVTLGEEVGYSIRFDDMSCEKTRLKYLTDGMLLREAMSDPLLHRYSVIILDEAHERTVHTDVLVGVVKELLPRRPDLRVVVMSATLEERRFQVYFPEAPLVHIAGRMFGVEVYYSRLPESNYVEAAIRTATQIHLYEGEGDILIFLTGEDEIETTVERLQKGIRMAEHSSADCHKGPVVVLPLYSALPPQQQRKVFQKVPQGTRKIVVATNVAETSLTIDGVVFVIDSGFSKQKVYNPRLRVESLLVTPISQASARQRCGRAGRTQPGKCFRLYTAKAFDTLLQPQTYPEILRCNLGSIVLHMKMMGVEDLVNFDFVEPPAPETLMRALELLNYLGAINDNGDMTEFGRRMAEFPLEPEMAAMLLHSPEYGCSDDIARICAMLSVQSPFINPSNDQRGFAMRCREQFYHPTGDHIALLNVFNAFYDINKQSTVWASENYLNSRVMKQAVSIYRQLLGLLRRLNCNICSTYSAAESGIDDDSGTNDKFANEIRRAILRGYFTKVALSLPTKSQFLTLKDDVKCLLFPSTFLNRRPKFVVFNELVLTSNTYIRTVTAVSDEWLLEASPTYFACEEFEGVSRQVFEELHRHRNCHAKLAGKRNEYGKKRPRNVESDEDSESC